MVGRYVAPSAFFSPAFTISTLGTLDSIGSGLNSFSGSRILFESWWAKLRQLRTPVCGTTPRAVSSGAALPVLTSPCSSIIKTRGFVAVREVMLLFLCAVCVMCNVAWCVVVECVCVCVCA